MLVKRFPNGPENQGLEEQKELVTSTQNLNNNKNDDDPNLVLAEEAEKGYTYRTKKGLLVKIKTFNRETKKVILIPYDTGSEVTVDYNYPLYQDIENPLVAERLKEFGEEIRTEDGYGTRKERKRKETKTSCVDSLLRESKDIKEIVEIISTRYDEQDIKKVKRLVWSRRALLKKEING